MPGLADYAINDNQKKIALLCETMSYQQTADHLGITRGVVANAMRSVKAIASRRGYSPEHDMIRPAPETHLVKGTSTYYDEDGKIRGQWVKTTLAHKRIEEFAEAVTKAAVETIKPIKPRKPTRKLKDPDVLVMLPVPDFHFGMYSWNEEAQGDWDCKLAEESMGETFRYVLENSPSSEKAVIANLGDFFHMDTPANVTAASGHSLDVDSRWSKVISSGLRVLISLINGALLKHDTVHVINERGNHDTQSAYCLTLALNAWYRNEPRVTIDQSPDVFHWYEFGQNFFGTHHGHLVRKPEQLYKVMAEDKREEFGRCRHRYWLTGHIHHHTSVDVGSVHIESFNTIIPRDNYAHSNGYRANRGLTAIAYHKDRGECSRVQCLIQND
jgi:hypothetical protein